MLRHDKDNQPSLSEHCYYIADCLWFESSASRNSPVITHTTHTQMMVMLLPVFVCLLSGQKKPLRSNAFQFDFKFTLLIIIFNLAVNNCAFEKVFHFQ